MQTQAHIENKKGSLLTLVKKFYVRRFPKDEEEKKQPGILTKKDFDRILKKVSQTEGAQSDEEKKET